MCGAQFFFNKRIQKHLLNYSYLPIQPKGRNFLKATQGSVDLSLFNHNHLWQYETTIGYAYTQVLSINKEKSVKIFFSKPIWPESLNFVWKHNQVRWIQVFPITVPSGMVVYSGGGGLKFYKAMNRDNLIKILKKPKKQITNTLNVDILTMC